MLKDNSADCWSSIEGIECISKSSLVKRNPDTGSERIVTTVSRSSNLSVAAFSSAKSDYDRHHRQSVALGLSSPA